LVKDIQPRFNIELKDDKSFPYLQIRVRELDAIDGTPVLDVKPYMKGFAPRGEVREPAWAVQLMQGYFQKV